MSDGVYRHPYQRPPSRSRWIPTTDSITTTLTPATTSLTLTTLTPTVRITARYFRTLTIDHTLVGGSTLTNRPVLVSLTHIDLKSVTNGGNVTSESGFDLLFFADAAFTTQLDHEVKHYNPATGQIVVWVKLASVSHTTDTVFYLKYGDASVQSSQEDIPGVWSNGYDGAFHLDGSPLSAVNSVTGGAGTINGVVSGVGQVNQGADFTGGSANDDIRTDVTSTPATRTYEIWSKRESDGGSNFGRMFAKGITTYTESLYNNPTQFPPDEIYIYFAAWATGAEWSIARPATGAYHFVAVSYDDSSAANAPLMYLDGDPATVTQRSAPTGSRISDSQAIALGNRPNVGSRKWDGQLDEFFVSNVIRSAGWVKFTFNNLSDPAAFVALGTQFEVGDVVAQPVTASLLLSTVAPSLRLTVAPTADTFTLTTFAPTINVSVVVAPASASFTLSTFTSQLRESLTPASAALTITTFAPSITTTVTVTPATALLNFTTFAPTIEIDVTVTPASALLELTTFSPQLRETVTPASTALELATFSPTLREVVSPTTASLLLTTFTPTLREVLTPSATSLTLTTFTPAVSVNINVTPNVRTLTLTTFVPVLRLVVTPSVSSLTLTTFAPTVTISANVTVTPATAALELATFAPILREVTTPAAQSFTLTTFTPTVSTRTILTPATAQLTLTTFAPTLAERITPATVALQLTTFAPIVVASGDVVLTPIAALFTLTTLVPSLSVGITPASAQLTVTMFASVVVEGQVVTPAPALLTLSTSTPTLQEGLTPTSASFVLTTFTPTVVITTAGSLVVVPTTANFTLTTFTPWLFTVLPPPNYTYVVESGNYEVEVEAGNYEYMVGAYDYEEEVDLQLV